MTEGARPDWVGRGIGLAVFAGGIVLLAVVFMATHRLEAPLPPQGQKIELDRWLIRFGVEIAKLFVSGLIASWIAGRGAQMYAAAGRALSSE